MKHLLTIALLAATVVSCNNSTDPGSSPDPRVRAFKQGQTKFTADTNRAITDRPVTLTLRCVPAVSGKGAMLIWEDGNYSGYWVVVESPMRDTLRLIDSTKPAGRPSIIYVDLVADMPIERSWSVRFPSIPRSATFGISALVILDSVYIPELGGWYDAHSDTAKNHTPGRFGYNPSDKDDDLYFSTP